VIIIPFDLETTVDGGTNKDSPEAYWENNKVLLCGWKRSLEHEFIHINNNINSMCEEIAHYLDRGEEVSLVAHNIKFDIKYLFRDRPDIPWHKVGLFCTMDNEYRLSGHSETFCSLEGAAELRGIATRKTMDLGAILASGLKMQDIPIADLTEYLKVDVQLVSEVFIEQHKLYPHSCEKMLALALMEYNGLKVDRTRTSIRQRGLLTDMDTLFASVEKRIKDSLEIINMGKRPLVTTRDYHDKIKVTAARTLSYIFTGYPQTGLNVNAGKTIWAKLKVAPILTQSEVDVIWDGVTPGHLGYPMGKEYTAKLTGIKGNQLLTQYLAYKQKEKLSSTYMAPLLANTTVEHDRVHPKLNTCLTATGRLSSSNPNGQNMPPYARECITGTHRLYDMDFTQMEVLALALESQDRALIADIIHGRDIHYETGKQVMGWHKPSDMTKKDRTTVKGVNFAIIYGGGALGIYTSTGTPLPMVKNLLKAFYNRYPRVKQWQAEVYGEVLANAVPAGHKEGEQIYTSAVKGRTSGRLFKFKQSKAPDWVRKKTGCMWSFKPTDTKNYPVQGLAGGDIVMDVLVMWYYLYCETVQPNEQVKLRMTVHDNFLIDTNIGDTRVKDLMKKACTLVEQRYGMPFNLAFDIVVGKHWS
jgi:DNA polymerase I-like protein with 3'-5' exonuclease and polymerase domains